MQFETQSAEKSNHNRPENVKTQRMFSIKWRFGITYSVFLLVTFACLFGVINWIFIAQSTTELENRALTVAKSVATSGSTPILGNKMDVFNKLVRDQAQLDPDVAYIIANLPDQQLLWHNLPEGLPPGLPEHVLVGNGAQTPYSFLKTDQRGIREAAVSILGGKGLVRVGISDLRVAGNIRKNQTVLIVVMMGAMLLGAVISILFSKKLTQPMVQLAEAANQISSGNMDVSIVQAKHNDEIRMLTDSFERMRESFSIAMRRLRARQAKR